MPDEGSLKESMLLLPTARAGTVIAVTVDDLAWQAGEEVDAPVKGGTSGGQDEVDPGLVQQWDSSTQASTKQCSFQPPPRVM